VRSGRRRLAVIVALMCGICGVASGDPRTVPLDMESLQAMTDVIAHRGPDDDGFRLDAGIALGMRRLSIIDLPGSRQPVANEDGSVSTVFNGEIYNFPDLRRDLVRRGHTLVTRGDTETIVHLYEDHGPDFVRRLRGMFAFAVWDAPRRRLVLARDRMGVKPLYLAEGPFGLAFASEVKSLVAGGLVEPRLDPLGAELFLAYGYVPGPRTIFAGVRKLDPASLLVWEDGRLVEERTYWSEWDDAPPRRGGSWHADQEQLLELLRTSVRARMISDVPLGVMLSGGLDSSLVTALMAEQSTRPVETFSIGFQEDGRANELADAQRVADRLGTAHHPLLTSAVDHPELLDRALWHIEEPIADLSCLGFLLLSELARQHVTVALSGQGADELLGGYFKHQVAWAAQVAGHVPAGVRGAMGRAGPRLSSRSPSAARALAAITTSDPVTRQLAMSRVLSAQDRRSLLTEEFRQPDAEAEIAGAVARHLEGRTGSVLAEVLAGDRRLALVDTMFLYFDKMSMAASLEVRVPFMDHDVVGFCAGLPDDRAVWWGRRKELLKRAARGLIDDEIIDKPKRGFFVGALGTWLRVHRDLLLRETLLDPHTLARGQINEQPLLALVQESGAHGKTAHRRLLSLLLLERWQRLWVDPDSPGRRLARSAAPSVAARS
jgi:asparagine synthase (glutamine-hydrolysing)